jgi:histone deacetylase 1/2
MDTGATDHLTNELGKLQVKEPYHGKEKVYTADGSGMHISHIGHAVLPTPSSRPLHLKNVLHVPTLTKNLLSVPRFTRDNRVLIEFHPHLFFVKDLATREVLLRGRYHGGLYSLDDPHIKQVFSTLRVSSAQWHARLGHPASQVVQHILRSHELPSVPNKLDTVCDACQQGKSHQLPFPLSDHVTHAPLELIYSDVWGPAQTSVSGHNYYVSFVDAYSRFTWLYLLKRKNDVFDIFLKFQAHVERLLGHKILRVQSDWGGEYIKLNAFFDKLGIMHRVSCPHTHQQNGTAERKHRHIVETGLTLLAHASVPFPYWSDAFFTACFLINRMPTKVIAMQTPLQRLLGEVPDYTFFKVFGCACWPNLRPYNNHKLQYRSKKCVFLGYSPLHKGYKCLHVPSNRVYISRDVIFDENVFPFSHSSPTPSESSTSHSSPSADQFVDTVHAPALLPTHSAGTGRGVRLHLLPDTADAALQPPHVAHGQLHGAGPCMPSVAMPNVPSLVAG